MINTYRNYVEEFYKAMDKGILAGQRCKKCGAVRYEYVAFCDKCGSPDLEEIELKPEGTLKIFSPTGDTLPEFSDFSTIDGVKLKNLQKEKGWKEQPATSNYVWGEVVLDDGPSIQCFVGGFGVMYNRDLWPALKTLPRRVHIDIRKVAGNSIPVARLID
ncbi:MAG: Zn-ribbon domain-containing OB-fold protein [Tractidigestivibacter sp.]|jgi:uncharacterized OB-fold protein|uniref:Zn-ribbon domain-containing OB-fold protein n=1 Tax=Tractidigestivibacter sp. TaxID=2847320 RepID=UPI003D8B54FA